MQKTGKEFDMNADTFTLDNLFAMELHNYHNLIGEIVNAATKEQGIEKGIKEVGVFFFYLTHPFIFYLFHDL